MHKTLLRLHHATEVSFLRHRSYFCPRASSTHTCSIARAFDVQGFAHAARKVDNQGISRREKRRRTHLLFPARARRVFPLLHGIVGNWVPSQAN
jgi:hypothetical protein